MKTIKCILILFVSISAISCGKKKFAVDLSDPNKLVPLGGRVGGDSEIMILLNRYPKDGVKGAEPQIVDYRVISVNSLIEEVTCTLDGSDIPCEFADVLDLGDLALGAHTFEIDARNEDGHVVNEIVSWTLYNSIVTKTKDISYISGRTADIIINVDNSYSMADIQTNMATRIANLLSRLTSLDNFNIAVITTDYNSTSSSHSGYIDGKLDRFSNGSYCLTKTTASSAMLGDLVQREESLSPSTSGTGYERGIYTTYRLFERAKISSSNEGKCLRPNIPKHVILISDENESRYLEDGAGREITSSPLDNLQKSEGTNLIQLASSTFGSASFKFHSIIINPFTNEGQACLAQKQVTAPSSKYGTAYAELSKATNGVLGSVCAADYTQQLQVIGESIANTQKSYGLDCVAVSNGGSMGSVKRLSNNQNITQYNIKGNNIEFTTDLPTDTYRVTYYCYQ